MTTPAEQKRALSAARMAQLPDAPDLRTGKERLRAGATETLLNGAGLLRDTWDDFKSSDRFFKYKAAVLATWLLLSVTSFGIACPGGPHATNSFGARLVVAGDGAAPIYMVKNDSPDSWQDVEVLVNGEYRSTAAQVDAQREITLSPVILYNTAGNRAPAELKITTIVVQIADDKVTLLENGKPQ